MRRLLEYVIAPRPPGRGRPAEKQDGDPTNFEGPSTAAESEDGNTTKTSMDELSEEDREKQEKIRLKYANIACEILSSETRSITDTLMENHQYLHDFWRFLERPSPLDPLEAGYFTKVNETLLDKKTEEMLAFIKTMDDVVSNMLRHVDCPVMMDLLLKIISLENIEAGQGIVDVSLRPG